MAPRVPGAAAAKKANKEKTKEILKEGGDGMGVEKASFHTLVNPD